MAKDAKGHGSDAHGGSGHTPEPPFVSRFAGQGVNYLEPGAGAHTQGVQQVGQPTPAKSFRMNSYTHEIVSPTGEVAARMNLGKNRGFGVDEGKGEGIHRSGGPSIHDAVAMPDYLASKKGSNSFPADHISGALHFLTGNDFAGHTVRRVKG